MSPTPGPTRHPLLDQRPTQQPCHRTYPVRIILTRRVQTQLPLPSDIPVHHSTDKLTQLQANGATLRPRANQPTRHPTPTGGIPDSRDRQQPHTRTNEHHSTPGHRPSPNPTGNPRPTAMPSAIPSLNPTANPTAAPSPPIVSQSLAQHRY